MKIFKKIIICVIWSVAIFILLIASFFYIPESQNFIRKTVTELLSKKLGTKVIIDAIHISVPNRFIIDNISIYDKKNEKMVDASRIAANLDLFQLIKNQKTIITSAQIFDLKAKLYKESDNSKTNFQFIIDSLSNNNNKKTPLDLKLKTLIIHNSNISYDILDKVRNKQKFDPNHILINNISAYININRLTDKYIDTNIKKLSLREGTGINIGKLSLILKANKKDAIIKNLIFDFNNSHINIPYYSINFNKNNIDLKTAQHKINISPSYIDMRDLIPLMPNIRGINEIFSFYGSINTQKEKINIKNLSIKSNTSYIKIKGYINKNLTKGNILVKKFITSPLFIYKIAYISHFNCPKFIRHIGKANYKGYFKWYGNNFTVNGVLKSSLGNANIRANITEKNITAEINTNRFKLGNILNSSKLGCLSSKINIKATKDLKTIKALGTFPFIEYNSIKYHNIFLNGIYSKDKFNGILSLNDPKGAITINGVFKNINSFLNKKGYLNIASKISTNHLNLKSLGLTTPLGNKTISLQGNIKAVGNSLNNIISQLKIKNIKIKDNRENFNIKYIDLNTHNKNKNKYIEINSDYGKIQIKGQFEYNTIIDKCQNILSQYLPTIIKREKCIISNDRFYIKAKIYNTKFINNITTNKNIVLYNPISIIADVEEADKKINLSVNTKNIKYKSLIFNSLNGTVHADINNKLKAIIKANNIGKDGRETNLTTEASTTNNGKIKARTLIDLKAKNNIKANINYNIGINKINNNISTHILFDKSDIMIDTIHLQLQPAEVSYTNKQLNIKNFKIANKQQFIAINSFPTNKEQDSLSINIKDINVPYILDILNFHSVKFGGTATGLVRIKHPLSNQQKINAFIKVKDFTFEDGRMGILYAKANYIHNIEKIDIDAKAIDQYGTTEINGYIDLKKQFINLPIKTHNTNFEFIHSYCKSVINKFKLRGNGICRIIGPLDKINLQGEVKGAGYLSIKPLKTSYKIKSITIKLIPNEIIIEKSKLKDKENNIVNINGAIHHINLTQITFDLIAKTNKAIVYDQPQNNNELFWGKIYTTGSYSICGRNNYFNIDANVKPERKSYIVYNADKNSIDESSFIKWNSKNIQKIKQDITNNEQPTSDLFINATINTNDNLTLKVILNKNNNDNIVLKGYNPIRATYYNKGSFKLYGNYKIDNGSYSFTIQDIIKKHFIFDSNSTITFQGDPFAANLNLKASYLLNSVPLSDLQIGKSFRANNTKVNCILNITGSPATPKANFGLELPQLSPDAEQMVKSIINSQQGLNQQVLYLLAVGRFYPQLTNNYQLQQPSKQEEPSTTSLAMQSILSGTISQQINTLLSNVIKVSNWNLGTNIATGNQGLNNAEYEGILSGSLLDNRLLINGQFGYRDNVKTNTSSLIGDFDIKYLLLPSGNLSLNFYNRANDRYFTRSSLNTQGIGLIMKKDFNSIKELFNIFKKKKKSNINKQ